MRRLSFVPSTFAGLETIEFVDVQIFHIFFREFVRVERMRSIVLCAYVVDENSEREHLSYLVKDSSGNVRHFVVPGGAEETMREISYKSVVCDDDDDDDENIDDDDSPSSLPVGEANETFRVIGVVDVDPTFPETELIRMFSEIENDPKEFGNEFNESRGDDFDTYEITFEKE